MLLNIIVKNYTTCLSVYQIQGSRKEPFLSLLSERDKIDSKRQT